jgi:hypothetical protein
MEAFTQDTSVRPWVEFHSVAYYQRIWAFMHDTIIRDAGLFRIPEIREYVTDVAKRTDWWHHTGRCRGGWFEEDSICFAGISTREPPKRRPPLQPTRIVSLVEPTPPPMPPPPDAPQDEIMPDVLDAAMPAVPDTAVAPSTGGASSSAGPSSGDQDSVICNVTPISFRRRKADNDTRSACRGIGSACLAKSEEHDPETISSKVATRGKSADPSYRRSGCRCSS